MVKPKVSICCLAYNQGKFIEQALDGFIMQKTNFDYDVLIHDDASTDNTAKIIKKYEKKYPNIIKSIYQSENQFSKGISGSKHYNFPRIQGEYVAMCEGDDYWTDENKLQRQVDFLDANPDYSTCFHPVRVFYEDGSKADAIFPSPQIFFNKKELELEDLLKYNFIQTSSVMYRWRFNSEEKIRDFFPDNIAPDDWYLHLLHAQKGKIGFIPAVMSDYRKHVDSLSWNIKEDIDNFNVKNGAKMVRFYLALEKNFPEYNNVRGHAFTALESRNYLKSCLKLNKLKEMKEIMDLCPDLLSDETIIKK